MSVNVKIAIVITILTIVVLFPELTRFPSPLMP